MNEPGAAVAAPSRRDWLSLATVAIGLGVIVLDGTIVAVALPAIIADLRLDLTDAQWVNSSYAVVLAALLLATGKLADRWGRRGVFLAGLTIFARGSVLAGTADSASACSATCRPASPGRVPPRRAPCARSNRRSGLRWQGAPSRCLWPSRCRTRSPRPG